MKSNTHTRRHTPWIRYLILVLLCVAFLVLFLLNLLRENRPADEDAVAISDNLRAITQFDFSDVATVESALAAIGEPEAPAAPSEDVAGSDQTVSNNQTDYHNLFASSVVVGDSITEGLSAYGYLGEEICFTEIGASVMGSGYLFDLAAATYPKNAFFSFGINDMGNYNGDASGYINRYKELLKAFCKTSPDTKIYINSIAPPAQFAIDEQPLWGNWETFNNALKEMCKKEGYTYVDTTSILKTQPELYEGDGLHVVSSYYPLWLDIMAEKAGLL